jgi:sugar O-acyltransferase (sialic acid O-acetyltransferase NeuD family)
MKKKRIAIIGAGGQAREVAWLIRDINRKRSAYDMLGFIVPDLSKLNKYDSREDLLGDESWLDTNRNEVDCLAIGIGNPVRRSQVAVELAGRFPDLSWPALIHPTALYDKDTCQIEAGVLLCAGATCTVSVMFGPFALINFGCTVGHEVRIGKACVVNPGANISGGVILGDEVLVGTGAQVLQYLRIGAGATIGAGAVVVKDVEAHSTVVGIPAVPLKIRRG